MRITLSQLRKIVKEEVSLAKERSHLEMDEEETMDAKIGSMKSPDVRESQRGNDENGQHDNDTEPGDPHVKKLKEAVLRDLQTTRRILSRYGR